jgi:hypothetical protein
VVVSVVVSVTVSTGAVTVLVGAFTVTLTGGELVAGVVTVDVFVVVLPPDARPIASPPPISSAAMIATTSQALLRLLWSLLRRFRPQTGQKVALRSTID